MSPRHAAAAAEPRRAGVLGALASALPDRSVPRRRPEVDDRPDLRVVEPTRRRRRGWQVGTVAGLLLFVALFVVAGAQALIVQQQRHLDDLNARIGAEEERADTLRLELAELQSPQRITTEATERLGMVPAPTPLYLEPRPDDDARAGEEPPPPTPTTTATTAAGTGR